MGMGYLPDESGRHFLGKLWEACAMKKKRTMDCVTTCFKGQYRILKYGEKKKKKQGQGI